MCNDIEIYKEKVRTYELLVNKAMNLSCKTFMKEVETWEEQIASDLFGRICAISFSLLKLIPESEIYNRINAIELWDYSSLCIITRSLFDTYFIYYHFCIDIPNDTFERDFKEKYWEYYKNYKRIKMLELIKSKNNELVKIKERNTKKLNIIKTNSYYLSLDDKQKKKLAKCELFQIPNNSDIAVKSGINLEFYKSTYQYLSSYVHSDSFCIDQIAIFKAGNNDSLVMIGTVIDYLIIILCFSIRDFVKICPELHNEIDDFIIEVIHNSEKLVKPNA
jgi:hypothetical protein